MRYKYSEKELNTLLKKSLVILIDTREKPDKNKHITQWLDSHKYRWKRQKLDYGDYSCYLEKNELTDKILIRDAYFDRKICIERKKDIDELCNNLADNGSRLKAELAHFAMNDIKRLLFIEDALFYKHLDNGNYRSLYKSETLKARLMAIQIEYDIPFMPVGKEYIGEQIYLTLYQYVRQYLKKQSFLQLLD